MSLATQVTAFATRVASEFKSVRVSLNTKVTGTNVTEVRILTQAEYDALGTKNATTLYVIQG